MNRFVPLLLLCLVAGCKQAATPVPNGESSGKGWEVRYNAALALGHRGSPRFADPVCQDTLLEMLDEDQQMRNFRVPADNGQARVDETAARMTVIGALKAIALFKEKQPKSDLTALKPAVEKLSKNGNPALAREARRTLEALGA